jgi:hypothetical protein
MSELYPAMVGRVGVASCEAGAVIAADNGATPHQLMAIFGWKTLNEAEQYTRAADQKMNCSGGDVAAAAAASALTSY